MTDQIRCISLEEAKQQGMTPSEARTIGRCLLRIARTRDDFELNWKDRYSPKTSVLKYLTNFDTRGNINRANYFFRLANRLERKGDRKHGVH